MPCVFIGDSLAYGTAQMRPDCKNLAVSGRNTEQTLLQVHQIPRSADHVLISVGANDLPTKKAELRKQIIKLRATLASYCVTWLLPPNNRAARLIITEIASNYGDQVLDVKPWVGADGVHPGRSGYQKLANQTRDVACDIIFK
jgi:lysophospholipase L1-like esterase